MELGLGLGFVQNCKVMFGVGVGVEVGLGLNKAVLRPMDSFVRDRWPVLLSGLGVEG